MIRCTAFPFLTINVHQLPPQRNNAPIGSFSTSGGLDALFPNEENPFPWMSEMIDLKKERNFFETRVIEYQTGGALSWE